MTHVYSAGGSRRAAVLSAIIGLHCAVLLLVLNDRIPAFGVIPPDKGPIEVLPPKPAPPVIVEPGKVVLIEPFGQRAEVPDIQLPDFSRSEDAADGPLVGSGPVDGTRPSVDIVVRTQASLQGRSRDFAAAVRACFPAAARRAGEEGLLRLAVTIGAGGQVVTWRVAESTGFPRLDAAARCVLDKLRFNAAREGGRAVQSEVILPVVFRLD